jgi:hypothetical protein
MGRSKILASTAAFAVCGVAKDAAEFSFFCNLFDSMRSFASFAAS